MRLSKLPWSAERRSASSKEIEHLVSICCDAKMLNVQVPPVLTYFGGKSAYQVRQSCRQVPYSFMSDVLWLCFLVSFPVVVFVSEYIVHEHVLKYQNLPWYFYC